MVSKTKSNPTATPIKALSRALIISKGRKMAFKEYQCSDRALAMYDAYMHEFNNTLAIADCKIIPNVYTSVTGREFLLCVESDYEIDFLWKFSFFDQPCNPAYLDPSDQYRKHKVLRQTNVVKLKKASMTYTLVGELGRSLLFWREDDVLFTGTYVDAIKAGFLEKIF